MRFVVSVVAFLIGAGSVVLAEIVFAASTHFMLTGPGAIGIPILVGLGASRWALAKVPPAVQRAKHTVVSVVQSSAAGLAALPVAEVRADIHGIERRLETINANLLQEIAVLKDALKIAEHRDQPAALVGGALSPTSSRIARTLKAAPQAHLHHPPAPPPPPLVVPHPRVGLATGLAYIVLGSVAIFVSMVVITLSLHMIKPLIVGV